MARHGFAVRSIWRSEHEDKVEFVYLLDWPDAATMKAAWAAFMADPEWAAIKKETGARHGRFVDAISDRTLEPLRSEEHTSELQSLMRISYAVFCLKKKK